MVLTLIIAESSVELVPNEIVHHPAVVATARRKNKKPSQLILDQSLHHSAMLRLRGRGVGRGRPDIAHFCLLTALGSPLNNEKELQCFVHTRDDHVITVDTEARLPRSTERFTSLLEKLYEDTVVPSSGRPLMRLQKETLGALVQRRQFDQMVALSSRGSDNPLENVVDELGDFKNSAVMVGGFSAGHFSGDAIKLSAGTFRIDKRRLEAWTVVGRLIYDYEKRIGLKRF